MGQEKCHSPLIYTKKLEGFFYQLVKEALFRLDQASSLHTEYYLVELLKTFAAQPKNPKKQKEEAFCLGYLKALKKPSSQAFEELKKLADDLLFLSGFFPKSLERKTLTLNYFMSLGRNAYYELLKLPQAKIYQEAFWELAQDFPAYRDVLEDIREQTSLKEEPNLLQWISRLEEGQSKRLEKQLTLEGIYLQNTSTLQ